MSIRSELTKFGFNYGAAEVARHCNWPDGCVSIGVNTKKQKLSIYVCKGGKVRVFDKNNVEWKPVAKVEK